jgi:hypothetical protein
MPVIGGGSFVLYGISLAVPSTLTDGALIDPGHAGTYYLTNIGVIPTLLPCDPEWTPPTLLDTTSHGTGWPAGAPPPGFVPNFTAGVNVLMGLFGTITANELAPPPFGFNFGNHWRMAGSGDVNFPTVGVVVHFPIVYADLVTDFLQLHIADYHAPAHEIAVWPTTPAASTPTTGPRITGSYNIIAWWWLLPQKDACGNEQTSHLVLAEEQPGDGYEKLDPNDSDAAPTPIITNIEPNHGRAGTRVAIIGEGFGDGANVQFDGVDAVDIDVISQYRVEATAPAHADGFASVAVINVDGVST